MCRYRPYPKKLEDLNKARQAVEQAAVEERNRLARDLHDAVSQTLFSAGIIAEVLPRIWDKNPEEGKRRLEEVRQLTRGALAEMRSLLFELRPTALAEAELRQLLIQLGQSATGRGRIPVEVKITGDCPEPPADVKIVLYRVAQEALNNIIKHSGATEVRLSLECASEHFILEITDNGHGFDPEKSSNGSFGLQIMQERVDSISAALQLTSEISKGTSIKVIWPGKDQL